MKSRFWSLYQALLNVHYGWSAGKYYYVKKRQRIWEPILIGASLAPVLILAIGFVWVMTENLFLAGLSFGQPHLALVYGSLMVSMLGLFFGFFYVLSAFYFSNDLPILVPLPFHSWEILLAKLGVVLTGQYVINVLILSPLWLKYALLAHARWGYVLSSLVVFITLPIIPLVIASLVTVLLMRFVNLSRHKDKLTLFGGIILLIIVFGFQFWLQNSLGTGNPEDFLQQLLSQTDGLVRVVGKVFPPSVWAAQAMAYAHLGQGWLNLGYLVVASLLGLGLLYFLGEKVFLQGLLAGLEGSKGGRRKKSLGGVQKPQGILWTLISIESKLFLRDPGFALNGLVGYVLLPVFAVLPLFSKNIEGNPFELLNLQALPPQIVVGGIALFFMVMTGMSMIPSTTFSREGKYLWIMRSLPLSIGQLVTTRVVAAQIINTIGCLVGLIPVAVIFEWEVAVVLSGTVLGILLASALAYLLVLFDLRRPMLDWVNPIKAVKSNLNAMVGLFGAMLIVFGLGALMFFHFQTQSLWLIPLELFFIALLLGALDVFLMKRFAQKLWSRI